MPPETPMPSFSLPRKLTPPIMHETRLQTAQQLLDYWGIPYLCEHDPKKTTWTGRCLNDWSNHDIGWTVHEVSHYLIGDRRYRKVRNYGLGSDPGSLCRAPCPEINPERFDIEHRVVIHDVLLFLYHDLPKEALAQHKRWYIPNLSEDHQVHAAYERAPGLLRIKVTWAQLRAAVD